MIRKISHTFLSSWLIISILGLTVNLHFCKGSLYSFSILTKAHSCCENPAHTMHNMACDLNGFSNTCKDESISLKVTDDYVGSSGYKYQKPASLEIFGIVPVIHSLECQSDNSFKEEVPIAESSPPGEQGSQSFLQSYRC